MKRLANALFVLLVFALSLFVSEWTANAQVDVYASLYGNNTGPVQAYAAANSQYQFGHVDQMWMQLSGPDGTSDEWSYNCTPTGGTGCPGFVDHTLTLSFQPDSDYDLLVWACASDDNGGFCSSDQQHYHTPPGGGQGMQSGVACEASYGAPYPYATSVDPQMMHLDTPGTYTVTIYGDNLEGVILGFSYIWSFNGAQLGGPGAGGLNVISNSGNWVSFTYSGSSGYPSEGCYSCGGKIWLQDPQTFTPCYVPIAVGP